MLGSIFIGLSGMNAYSNGLRQISNNIVNLNSLGFKSSDLTFVNLFGAGSGGQGVALGEGVVDFAQGELRQTDRALDLAIDGAGFLVLLRDAEQVFARTGGFEITDEGDIVLAGTEYRLSVLDDSGAPRPLSIATHRTHPPQATTTIEFTENLSASATSHTLSNIRVFDAQGDSDTWQVRFERSATSPPGEWTVIALDGAGAEIDRQTLRFIGTTPDPSASRLTFEDDVSGRSVTLDFSRASSFSSGAVSTLKVESVDGYAAGELTAVQVNDEGALELTYSNGQTVDLGSIAIATFRDPQELEQLSGGLFAYRGESGREYQTSASERVGKVVSGRLEASNVDLAREFGDLILVQRGFQASSQVISVSNDMIQQLFGIRGQG